MAQARNPFGLRVDTSLTSGQLSLHEYRKFLSRPDAAVNMTPASPQPRLRRKPAALHLCQRGHHGFGSQFQSPASSAPSSPPPLSYTQSVVSFSGELQTPISPISISRPFSQPVPAISSRRVDPYSTRQKNSKRGLTVRHSRNVSDISLPSTSSGVLKVKHDGTEFEIVNPKGAMLPVNTDPLYQISNESRGTMEHESPGTSRSPSFASYRIPEDVIRPISASESAVLSRYTSAAPFLEQQQQPDSSFSALPPLHEASLQPPSPMSPKTPSRTLKEKVSRLFGSSEKRLSWKGDSTHYEKQSLSQVRDGSAPSSSRVEQWNAGDITKPTPQPAKSVTSSTQQSTPRESEDSKIRRRPSPRGPHSANRHQTLEDALEQLETENNGLTFENIMRYIATDDEKQSVSRDDETKNQDNAQVERPWQPDTWAEPTRSRMPHNRPSDSNLSITAPSTRASIRPYVERAAAFMAKGGAISISSSSSSSSLLSDPEKKHENGDVRLINEYEDQPTAPLRRIISRRARPLSSNPPDLDAPILHDSAYSPSEKFESLMSAHHFSRPQLIMHHSPMSQVGESPHIPPRHPNHRLIRFDISSSLADSPVTANAVSTIPSSGIPPPGVTPIPESATVTTIVAAPKKKSKKYVSGCRCI